MTPRSRPPCPETLCRQRASLGAQSGREPGWGLLDRTKPQALGSPSQQAEPTLAALAPLPWARWWQEREPGFSCWELSACAAPHRPLTSSHRPTEGTKARSSLWLRSQKAVDSLT